MGMPATLSLFKVGKTSSETSAIPVAFGKRIRPPSSGSLLACSHVQNLAETGQTRGFHPFVSAYMVLRDRRVALAPPAPSARIGFNAAVGERDGSIRHINHYA